MIIIDVPDSLLNVHVPNNLHKLKLTQLKELGKLLEIDKLYKFSKPLLIKLIENRKELFEKEKQKRNTLSSLKLNDKPVECVMQYQTPNLNFVNDNACENNNDDDDDDDDDDNDDDDQYCEKESERNIEYNQFENEDFGTEQTLEMEPEEIDGEEESDDSEEETDDGEDDEGEYGEDDEGEYGEEDEGEYGEDDDGEYIDESEDDETLSNYSSSSEDLAGRDISVGTIVTYQGKPGYVTAIMTDGTENTYTVKIGKKTFSNLKRSDLNRKRVRSDIILPSTTMPSFSDISPPPRTAQRITMLSTSPPPRKRRMVDEEEISAPFTEESEIPTVPKLKEGSEINLDVFEEIEPSLKESKTTDYSNVNKAIIKCLGLIG
jgi:hypothetical protein